MSDHPNGRLTVTVSVKVDGALTLETGGRSSLKESLLLAESSRPVA